MWARKAAREASRYEDLPTAASGQPDVRLFAEGGAAAPTGASELAQASRRRLSRLSGESIIRLNRSRVYRPDGSHRPTEYIYQRLRAVDGLSVEAAKEGVVTDKDGSLKGYGESDLKYDLQSGWVVLDSAGEASVEAAAKAAARIGVDDPEIGSHLSQLLASRGRTICMGKTITR